MCKYLIFFIYLIQQLVHCQPNCQQYYILFRKNIDGTYTSYPKEKVNWSKVIYPTNTSEHYKFPTNETCILNVEDLKCSNMTATNCETLGKTKENLKLRNNDTGQIDVETTNNKSAKVEVPIRKSDKITETRSLTREKKLEAKQNDPIVILLSVAGVIVGMAASYAIVEKIKTLIQSGSYRME